MRVTTAQLPGPKESDDRIFVGPDVVIMLDGASAFVPTDISASEYVDTLGPRLLDNATDRDEVNLVDALADAIGYTASTLNMSVGSAPSSTVAMARRRDDFVDLLVLGDTQIVTPSLTLIDKRLVEAGARERTMYRTRLEEGRGFDEEHRKLLRDLQLEQRRCRNHEGGYWIAEADPDAALHAMVRRTDRSSTAWCVLATDGAYRPMIHLDLANWPQVVRLHGSELQALLERCQSWESDVDPDGALLPRAKRHDDKSIATLANLSH